MPKKKQPNYTRYGIIALIILVIIVLGFVYVGNTEDSEVVETIQTESGEIKVTADGTKYIVDPAKIRSGGPPKDGIPSIDNPRYVSVATADEWIADNELVLALEYNGVKRVYPLQIMVWHEIVNDEINGERILITWCPLCGSGIAYKPIINVNGKQKAVEFGTSGKLYNSNLVMYDRETDTYWSQIDGNAIVGELTGQELEEVSIDVVPWRSWKVHEDSEVLSQETGFSRNYGKDPYGNYYEDSFLFFPVENEDNRIHNKDVIHGIEIDGVFKAYRERDITDAGGVIEDVVNNVNIKIEMLEDGRVFISNVDTGEEIVKERDFWFAWYAFHPDTLLYGFD